MKSFSAITPHVSSRLSVLRQLLSASSDFAFKMFVILAIIAITFLFGAPHIPELDSVVTTATLSMTVGGALFFSLLYGLAQNYSKGSNTEYEIENLAKEVNEQPESTNFLYESKAPHYYPAKSGPIVGSLPGVTDYTLSLKGDIEGEPFKLYMLINKQLSGSEEHTTRLSIIEIDTKKNIPHLVIDAHANETKLLGIIPAKIDSSQRISLEGDFDKYFTVHALKNSQSIALDILSPDFMEMIITENISIDLEFVDKKLYLIAEGNVFEDGTFGRFFKTADLMYKQLLPKVKKIKVPKGSAKSKTSRLAFSSNAVKSHTTYAAKKTKNGFGWILLALLSAIVALGVNLLVNRSGYSL